MAGKFRRSGEKKSDDWNSSLGVAGAMSVHLCTCLWVLVCRRYAFVSTHIYTCKYIYIQNIQTQQTRTNVWAYASTSTASVLRTLDSSECPSSLRTHLVQRGRKSSGGPMAAWPGIACADAAHNHVHLALPGRSELLMWTLPPIEVL